jgi:hypothetical protein
MEEKKTEKKLYYKSKLNSEEQAALDNAIVAMKQVLGEDWDELYDAILTAIHHNIGLTINQLKNKITTIYLDKLQNGNIEERIRYLKEKGLIDNMDVEAIINVYIKKQD